MTTDAELNRIEAAAYEAAFGAFFAAFNAAMPDAVTSKLAGTEHVHTRPLLISYDDARPKQMVFVHTHISFGKAVRCDDSEGLMAAMSSGERFHHGASSATESQLQEEIGRLRDVLQRAVVCLEANGPDQDEDGGPGPVSTAHGLRLI